ncbi:hypothetical protein BCV72DRAFT_318045 [Rhizopus microsporus var. microsporus]|uniref:Helitron helicase-like domain-containing protein n=1 Tax=Rhizopus microsporus var. microsporus TaxID=86635 RepID=A0A1X0RIW2_RHIZD|nr:hypothetical protein BCV72DRAFT_318045 [Rhizopus microsporus var. microsporus]
MENNTSRTTICSSCVATLPADSRYCTCQACRERVAASRRRCRAEQEEQEGSPVRRRGRLRVEPSQTIPAAYISQLSRLRPLDLGRMDKECSHCHALHWTDERQETSSMRNPSWESCCKQRSVQLQLLSDPPEYLKDLLEHRHFKDNFRQYNAAFAFTSLGCDIVSPEDRANNTSNNNNNRGGLNAFQIHGALCHRQGPLTPVEGSEPSYTQLYIFDPCYAAERRQARSSNLDPEIVRELSVMLAQCNPFARIYRHAHEILNNYENSNSVSDGNDQREVSAPYIIISPSMRMCLIEGSDRRTHNLPTMEEIAAVIPIKYSDRSFRDIVLTLRSNSSLRQSTGFEQRFQTIIQAHTAYMPSHYLHLFLHEIKKCLALSENKIICKRES